MLEERDNTHVGEVRYTKTTVVRSTSYKTRYIDTTFVAYITTNLSLGSAAPYTTPQRTET